MPQHVCPTCGAPVDRQTTPAMPFCSERCRQIDLGRWLNEDFSLPVEGEDVEGAEDEAD